jgi:4-hydroxy-3-polyprenylbenzoate decarboxylase
MRLIVGISGASGVIYGVRLLQALHKMRAVETHLVMTNTAKMNLAIETELTVRAVESLAKVVYDIRDMAAGISSGSNKTDGMIVAPCS